MFQPGSPVQQLASEASAAMGLAQVLRSVLPPDLGDALRSASLHDGTVVITAASPVWAARLRFESSALLAACRARFPAAERVKVRVGGSPDP
jgi:hypothetical protein